MAIGEVGETKFFREKEIFEQKIAMKNGNEKFTVNTEWTVKEIGRGSGCRSLRQKVINVREERWHF